MDPHADKDIAYHDLIAPEYHQVVVESRAAGNAQLFRPFDKLVGKARAMLDVGCGTGHMLLRFGSRFSRCVAVDHSAGMLAQASANCNAWGIAVEAHQGDALAFVRGCDEHFDLITCVGFLHHLQTEDIPSALSLMAQRLAPGGLLLLAEPVAVDPGSEPAAIQRWNRAAPVARQDYSVQATEPDEAPISLELIHAGLEQAGLEIVREQRGWEVFPHHTPASFRDRLMIRYFNWRYGDDGIVLAIAATRFDG